MDDGCQNEVTEVSGPLIWQLGEAIVSLDTLQLWCFHKLSRLTPKIVEQKYVLLSLNVLQKLPSGDWRCVYCSCKFCGTFVRKSSENDVQDDMLVSELLTCHLCEGKCIFPNPFFVVIFCPKFVECIDGWNIRTYWLWLLQSICLVSLVTMLWILILKI